MARAWVAASGRIALAVVLGVVILNPVLLYFLQERLLFYPHGVNEENRALIRERFPAVREVTVTAGDGTSLHGWFQKSPAAARAPLLIYFGGNAEDVSFVPSKGDRVAGWSMLAIAYRGYGLSRGEAGERALFDDALAIYDAFARRDDVDPARIAVLGRSLGSGVATYVAAHRPVHAAVLVTPYDSVLEVARAKFWFVPVGLILRHRFDSAILARAIARPALFVVASEDEVIPVPHARRLYEAWAGPKKWHVVEGEKHDTIDFNPDYWTVIAAFLAAPTP